MFHKSQVLTISFLNTNWSILKLLSFLGLKFFATFHHCCFLLDQNYSEVIVDWRQILFCCYIQQQYCTPTWHFGVPSIYKKDYMGIYIYYIQFYYNAHLPTPERVQVVFSLNYSVYIFIHLCLSFLYIFTVLLAFSAFFPLYLPNKNEKGLLMMLS